MLEFDGGIKNLASETLRAWKCCHGNYEECESICPYHRFNEYDEDGEPIEYECLEYLDENIDQMLEHYTSLTKE